MRSSLALLALLLPACSNIEAPNPSYTGPLRVQITPHDTAKKPPSFPSKTTTFAFKTSGTVADLDFAGCHVTFELPKAKGDRYKWVLKSGGPCATPAGPGAIRKGEFVLYPGNGILITMNGALDDGSADVEWSTITGPP